MKYTMIFLSALVSYKGCKKDHTSVPMSPAVCDVRGTYSGIGTSATNPGQPIAYVLSDNNFAIGYITVGGEAVTFGGYRNTCDSVIFSVYYTTNRSYYLLKGKLSADHKTISGSQQNLTTPTDFGTFTLTRQ